MIEKYFQLIIDMQLMTAFFYGDDFGSGNLRERFLRFFLEISIYGINYNENKRF